MKRHIALLLSLCLLSLSQSLVAEEPWGKDATLRSSRSANVKKKSLCSNQIERKKVTFGQVLLKALIRFHQKVLTHADGPRSHFYPCSSTYMLHAVQHYGAWEGYVRGCDRLLRENSDLWVYRQIIIGKQKIKYDPVN